MLEHHPRLVAVTHIPTSSGLVQPVAQIGAFCRKMNILYLVDGCQSAGQLAVNIPEIQCDFYSATGRKFMRAPRGTGFLYVSDRVLERGLEPLFIDSYGAEWLAADEYRPFSTARRFEDWEFSHALVHGLGEAVRYANNVGIHAIEERAVGLARLLREQLRGINGVRVLDNGANLCAIVTAQIQGWEAQPFKVELQKRRINCSLSTLDFARIDFGQKGIEWALRLSPHYYNTEDEITSTVEAVREIIHC